MPERSPKGIPAKLVAQMQRQIGTWSGQVPDAGSLMHQVQLYWDEIEAASLTTPLLDRDLAAKIRTSLVTALHEWSSIEIEDRAWVAVAVAYFIESNDDEHDIDSPVGFDDDAEVVNAIMTMIGRTDLVIQ